MPYADWFNEALATALMAALPASSPAAQAKTDNSSVVTADQDATDESEDLSQADILRKRLVTLLQEAGNKAGVDGLFAEDIEAADFAVCAFMDEALLSSDWSGRKDWMTRPLQLERHGTGTAGEEFFTVLDLLLEQSESGFLPNAATPEQSPRQRSLAATLEVFALCLMHGFTGMYFQDNQPLRNRLERIARIVPSVGLGLAPLEQHSGLFVDAHKPAPRRRLNMLRRIDVLDCLLWLAPPLVVALLYNLCETRLNLLLNALSQGGA
ncbi:MAG: DotU family type IV/VI secretion system protein [Desulfovibrio sp.]|jgi:type VI secretion system protein ImpK|nr:DotU family type IV/VI secretion system protein [Desulfovibrio sp.]